jgi:hypothetical protein
MAHGCNDIHIPKLYVRAVKDSSSTLIFILLVAVLIASVRHIAEAIKKRDPEAIGEGLGTMLFSGIGIILKALG